MTENQQQCPICQGPLKGRWGNRCFTCHPGGPRIPQPENGMKLCSMCKERKPVGEFGPDARMKAGLKSECRECAQKVLVAWRERNPDKYDENKRLKRTDAQKHQRWILEMSQRYGLTLEQYETLEAKQNGVCAICKGPHIGRGARFHVDHCHATGKVRGLLCGPCNTGLGAFRDNPDTLRAAIEYLQ